MSTRAADRWFFDTWSSGYDLALPQRLAYRPVHDAVVQALGPNPRGRRILDVGCGTGELVVRLRAVYPKMTVVGYDFSAGMLKHAAAKPVRARWVRGDACRLPFRHGAFDVITCTEAFHWFPDQDGALREFHRVLSPGGQLLLAAASPPFEVLSWLAYGGSRLVGEPFYWPTRSDMRDRLSRTGFRVEEQRRVFRLPGFLLLPVLTKAVSVATVRPNATGRAHTREPAAVSGR